ncbi:hypothetical protein NQ176_g1333 [Zarea fungicola]|uniref:Uncharacterized protein n=1 Tax=Zarea fungicola TaxID=93591 RepID=A0ACC1NVJ8_9HYPO|nr:hypothetical protein NQ176_g1333 [Lecanicillium fungicola]
MTGNIVHSVAVIVASTRNPRIGRAVAETVLDMLQSKDQLRRLNPQLVDLVDFKLPIFDEAVVPANIPERAQFSHAHSKKWSEEIKKHQGYIIVSPEYNFGIPGGFKNAIDYLMHEWKGKPVAIVTYGVTGGKLCSDMLHQVLSKVGLKVAATRPQLTFKGGVGPDAFAAMGGRLGEDTRTSWKTEKEELIVAAAEELQALLFAET